MSTFAVPESDWRRVSNCASEVDGIRLRYAKFLKAMAEVVGTARVYVPDLAIEVDASQERAVVRSFAGECQVHLGWRVNGEELEGVAVFSKKTDGPSFQPLLNVYLTERGGQHMTLASGEIYRLDMRPGDFAYAALMNVVWKQVELSTQV